MQTFSDQFDAFTSTLTSEKKNGGSDKSKQSDSCTSILIRKKKYLGLHSLMLQQVLWLHEKNVWGLQIGSLMLLQALWLHKLRKIFKGIRYLGSLMLQQAFHFVKKKGLGFEDKLSNASTCKHLYVLQKKIFRCCRFRHFDFAGKKKSAADRQSAALMGTLTSQIYLGGTNILLQVIEL